MKELHNVSLAEKTTFRVGGTALNYYIPENTDELITLVCRLNGNDYRFISGGSNMLINDKQTFENIIFCGEFDSMLTDLGEGRFYIGASNRIQKVISFVNDCGYGGFEELIGLPAMFGGIIYMNAGIGGRGKERFNICDFIERVKCLDKRKCEIVWLNKDDCGFAYRDSIFKTNDYIILGAEIRLKPQDMLCPVCAGNPRAVSVARGRRG